MNTVLYGIKNCDTVKKARNFLQQQGVDYQFHDFREQGISADLIHTWLQQLSAEQLINKRSTTWKQLSSEQQAQINQGDIIDVCLAHPTLIKRPVLAHNNTISVGFNDQHYLALFA
jgi:arsenate reductase (glutaredoxin)